MFFKNLFFFSNNYVLLLVPFDGRHYYRFVPEIQSFDKSKCAATQSATSNPLHNIQHTFVIKIWNHKSNAKPKSIDAKYICKWNRTRKIVTQDPFPIYTPTEFVVCSKKKKLSYNNLHDWGTHFLDACHSLNQPKCRLSKYSTI